MRKTKEEAARTRKSIVDAARRVFHRCGVIHSSMDDIAQEAGVTRGAIYWHFKSKPEILSALREGVLESVIQGADKLLYSDEYGSRLDALEASINEFFRLLNISPHAREVLETMSLRCESVGEFIEFQMDVARPGLHFLSQIEVVYLQASADQELASSLDPLIIAKDTWVFATGLLHLFLRQSRQPADDLQISEMVHTHIGLRKINRNNAHSKQSALP